jgi:hypothetical protein
MPMGNLPPGGINIGPLPKGFTLGPFKP